MRQHAGEKGTEIKHTKTGYNRRRRCRFAPFMLQLATGTTTAKKSAANRLIITTHHANTHTRTYTQFGCLGL